MIDYYSVQFRIVAITAVIMFMTLGYVGYEVYKAQQYLECILAYESWENFEYQQAVCVITTGYEE